MTTNHHTALTNTAATADLINNPLGDLDSAISNLRDGTLALTAPDINGGSIDGAVIGGASAGAGTFTNLTVNGDMNLGGAFMVNYFTEDVIQIADSTSTELVFNNVVFDTSSGSDYSTSTGRFTPQQAGRYMFMASLAFTAGTADKFARIRILKNGSAVNGSAQFQQIYPDGTESLSVNVVAFSVANGTTDYYSVFAYHEFGSGKNLDKQKIKTYFGGMRIG